MTRSFTVGGALLERLEEIRVETERPNILEVIRDAVRVYFWVVEQYQNGNEVLTQSGVALPPIARHLTLVKSDKDGK